MIGRNSEPSLIRIYYNDEEFYRCAKIPKLLLAPIIETARAIRPRHLCIRKRLAESKLDGTNLKRVLICCTSCTYGLSRRIEDIMPVLKMIQTILEYQRVNSKPNKENPVVGPTNCDILPIELGQILGGSKSKV